MAEATGKTTVSLIPEDLLSALKADIDLRRIGDGMSRLAGCTHIFDSFRPSDPNAAAFLGTLAQWCDIGYADLGLVKRLIETYSNKFRLKLCVSDHIQLRMAQGMVAMAEETLDEAMNHFDVVLKLADEAEAWDVIAIVSHWMARCQRKKGQYESALAHIKRAREVQAAHGHVQNEGPARVLEALIMFEKGEPKHAIRNLREAEAVLSRTDDYVTLGNIQATYGRILQRELRYGQAIKHYEQAIEQFKKCNSKYANIGRALIDMSFTRILMARYLRQNIEAYPGQSHKGGRGGPSRAPMVKELSNLYQTVLADLERAEQIHQGYPNARGVSRVHLIRGYLYLDMGELTSAAEEGAKAYGSAESKQDFMLMASARNLQCMVENAAVEEEVEGWAEHAVASRDYARDAVELAGNTQDRRLLANVHTWYGLTLSNAFFNSKDAAREAMERAGAYLESSVHDHIWEDFQTLRKRLLENATLEPKLLQWVHGEIGNKTFRQLEEDFADLVIPRIWDQEKRKVSRVAARLSISPKKVRRVLVRMGLLEARNQFDEEREESTERVVKRGSGRKEKRIVKLRIPRG